MSAEISLSRARGRRSRAGWIIVHEPEIEGGKGHIWQHHSGWKVSHCGHPTAHRPWTARGPLGEPLILDGEDQARCYSHLAAIQEMVELHLHNEACG